MHPICIRKYIFHTILYLTIFVQTGLRVLSFCLRLGFAPLVSTLIFPYIRRLGPFWGLKFRISIFIYSFFFFFFWGGGGGGGR